MRLLPMLLALALLLPAAGDLSTPAARVIGRDQREAMQRTQSYLVATAEAEAKRQPVQIRSVQ